jgi:phage tail sheath protein FI
MAEYLSPGVFVEEVPSPRSIEGVSTTVTGFIGPTRFGPTLGDPELLTSYLDFARIFCGVDALDFTLDAEGGGGTQANYIAHAVRAFFDNGGSKLYVTRVYRPDPNSPTAGLATYPAPGSMPALLTARSPGTAGNMKVVFAVRSSPNVLVAAPAPNQNTVARASGLGANDLVFLKSTSAQVVSGLYDVVATPDGSLAFQPQAGLVGQADQAVPLSALDAQAVRAYRLLVGVQALRFGQFETVESWADLSPNPLARNALTSIFTSNPASREAQLTVPFAITPPGDTFTGSDLLVTLFGEAFVTDMLAWSLATDAELKGGSLIIARPTSASLQVSYTLQGGSDGLLPQPLDYQGSPASRDPETQASVPASGLETFADIPEISIIAAPGSTFDYNNNPGRADEIVQLLIEHCEIRMKYRVALLDSPNDFIVSEVQTFRGKFDSSYAALYYPWLKIMDPLDPDGRREVAVPPSGFIAGICARSDVANGVSKAPANEIPLGAIDLEMLLNTAQQDVLNPIGVNCLRPRPLRGIRVWGARTISSDPDWKYLNVRRYFAYVEHSIDNGTQWAVFEKNDEITWAGVARTIYDFLFNEWKNDALMGTKPEQAFFVRCDRSTMTQNDLDNGRLICLVGIAVIKPAEFVIFRIGQFTADATS